MGRPNKYESHVKPHLSEVQEMAEYMTERQIAETLGVSMTAWKEYKRLYPALKDVLKKGRSTLVKDLRSALIKRAKGFQYTETKVTKEAGKVVKEEIAVKTCPPDVAALNLALKNYDRENWANDPQALELRKKELELREKQIEKNDW